MQAVAQLDEQGNGYIDLQDFIKAFDMGEEAKARRSIPSLSGLPCRAVYHGGARVATFPKDTLTVWSPTQQEDAEAADKHGTVARTMNAQDDGRFLPVVGDHCGTHLVPII